MEIICDASDQWIAMKKSGKTRSMDIVCDGKIREDTKLISTSCPNSNLLQLDQSVLQGEKNE